MKWQLPFTSLAGNSCVVKIYAEGFTGDVTTLTGGAEPFVIEEDDSKNLLELVRSTSGYLNVVEETYGDLDALFPTTDFQHMVTLEVNNRVQFTGFMQATEYDNDWDRGPRELHFPVMSPLGLMDHRTFPSTYSSPVRNIAICELLAYVLTDIDCGYTDVYVPATTLNIDQMISTLAINPFNNNFKASGHNEEIHNHESYEYLIEGICAAFGWMVHDVPGALVFVKWNWTGGYYRCPLSTLASFTHSDAGILGSDELDFDDYFVVSSADNRQSYLRPLKEITLSIDGETAENAHISYDRMHYEGYSQTPNFHTDQSGDDDCVAAWLSPLADDVGGPYVLAHNGLNNSGGVVDTGVNVAKCGDENSQTEKILIRWDMTWNDAPTSPIFYVNIFNPPSGAVEIKFHALWSSDNKLAKLGNSDFVYGMYPRCLVAKLYLDDVPYTPIALQPSPRYPLMFNKSGYWSLFFPSVAPLPFCHKLTIEFYPLDLDIDGYGPYVSSTLLLALNEISVNSTQGLFAEYTEDRTRLDKIVGGSDSASSGTLNMPLSFYRLNSHMISAQLQTIYDVQRFDYMFQSKKVVEVTAKAIAQLSSLVYGQKIILLGTPYRLVSAKYEPREDDWTLLLIQWRESVHP